MSALGEANQASIFGDIEIDLEVQNRLVESGSQEPSLHYSHLSQIIEFEEPLVNLIKVIPEPIAKNDDGSNNMESQETAGSSAETQLGSISEAEDSKFWEYKDWLFEKMANNEKSEKENRLDIFCWAVFSQVNKIPFELRQIMREDLKRKSDEESWKEVNRVIHYIFDSEGVEYWSETTSSALFCALTKEPVRKV